MTDEYFMMQAFRQAKIAFEDGEVPVGAVVVINNKIVARGHNMVERLNDPTAHAEMIALTSAFNLLGAKYIPEAAIFITIEPCIMCAGAIFWSKLGKIVYGAEDEKNGYKRMICGDSSSGGKGKKKGWPFHPKAELITGVMKEECSGLMKDFFKSKR